jgi:Putative auto-transporter adhesin, head GIN domain
VVCGRFRSDPNRLSVKSQQPQAGLAGSGGAGQAVLMGRTAIMLLSAITLAAGCHRREIEGNGVIKTENRPIADFSGIAAAGRYEIEWSSGKPALTISTDENLLPLIRTEINDGTLRVDSKENLNPTRSITINLSSASLADVKLTGGNRFRAGSLSGSKLKLTSTGASEINVEGSVTELEATLIGASKLSAKSLQTQNATLSLTGASDADITVTETLKVSVTGAGSLTYSGNPKSVQQEVIGAGSIHPRP